VNSITKYAEVRSKPGDPIQLANLRPVDCEFLVRLGNPNDGGYVVPLEAVKASDALVSFGLSHNWTFERDFNKASPRAVVHCYDHSVSFSTAVEYSIGRLLRFLTTFKSIALWKSFTWIDYIAFFRGNRVHFKQKVWDHERDNSVTIEDVFGRLPLASQVFIKMDVEGSEYRVLDQMLQHSGKIAAMAVEFHDVDILSDQFNSFIDKIKRDFYVVHLHGNNMGGTTSFGFPIAPEITFLHKRFFKSVPQPSRLQYPLPGLDSPNDPGMIDFAFVF
jgi:hypothetical protein